MRECQGREKEVEGWRERQDQGEREMGEDWGGVGRKSRRGCGGDGRGDNGGGEEDGRGEDG